MRTLLLGTLLLILSPLVLAEEADTEVEAQVIADLLALEGIPLPTERLDDSDKRDEIERAIYRQLAEGPRPTEGASSEWFGQSIDWRAAAPADAQADTLGVWMLPIRTERFVQGSLEVTGLERFSAYLAGDKLAASDGKLELALPAGTHDLWLIHTGPAEDAEPSLSFQGKTEADRLTIQPGAPAWVTPERLTNAETVNAMVISPDGEQLALRFSGRSDIADLDIARLEIRRTDDNEIVRRWTDNVPSSIAWSPDSRTLAVQQGNNLWLYPNEGAPRLLLANQERLGGWQWHPDGDSLIFSWTEEAEAANEQRRRVRSLEDRWAGFRNQAQLFQVDVASGLIRPLTQGEMGVNLLDVSPSGDRLLIQERIIDYAAPPHSLWRLSELDMASLETREIGQFRMLGGALFADEGYWLLSGPGLPGADGATTGEDLTPNEYDTQLYRLSADGEARSVSRDFDPSINEAHRLPDGRLLISATHGEGGMLAVFDPRRSRFEEVETGVEVLEQFVASEGSRVKVAVRGSDANRPQRVHLIDLDRGQREVVLDTRDTEYRGVELGPVEPWRFVNRDGIEIDGRYYLPPDFDPGETYPLIVYYYGGTMPVGRAFTGRYPFNLWAARGYVIYVLQPHGTIGYGQDFSAAHVNAWGRITADDIIEGAEKFIAEHDFVTEDAVGNIGASYGGFMTMYLATRTDMFTASISHAGISTLTSYWGEGWWGYGYSGIASRDSFPWNNPELYVEQSPIYSADRITTPLLLLTGDSDTNVPPGESDTMFTALKLLGRDVELIEFPGEDHWILDREKRYVWWDTIIAWFDKHLKQEPEWWEYLYSETE
ncbi:prolyl oligopeptidase family serine peptidase [Wenzhouxiangella marina]|uniref:Peptidase S9, prolyl oligopeptidase active site domain protein n=1 Tax=Wenzhouxiangella marina TaxID=1579979 RepID=A0A0K0XZK3_9GAMM|nr:prolyl oligopeptidase family serine peptidase [Wenzhouxiangella marina]AKS43118.1 Peptidase S9, prolyl oligopeptidase active site domain protein [Wenzhouxiangella marina]MBB6087197.1 acylaminoacyl-peptidase [Wenzhouxiangella marina]